MLRDTNWYDTVVDGQAWQQAHEREDARQLDEQPAAELATRSRSTSRTAAKLITTVSKAATATLAQNSQTKRRSLLCTAALVPMPHDEGQHQHQAGATAREGNDPGLKRADRVMAWCRGRGVSPAQRALDAEREAGAARSGR